MDRRTDGQTNRIITAALCTATRSKNSSDCVGQLSDRRGSSVTATDASEAGDCVCGHASSVIACHSTRYSQLPACAQIPP